MHIMLITKAQKKDFGQAASTQGDWGLIGQTTGAYEPNRAGQGPLSFALFEGAKGH